MLYSVGRCNMAERLGSSDCKQKKKAPPCLQTPHRHLVWVKGLANETNGHLGNETHEMKRTNTKLAAGSL